MAEQLSIEELQARLAAAEAEKADAQARASALEAEKEAIAAEKEKLEADYRSVAAEREQFATLAEKAAAEKAEKAPLSFKTEDGEVYEFTCPTFTWDDGRVIDPKKLVKDNPDEFATICGHLIQRNSGIIRRKEA